MFKKEGYAYFQQMMIGVRDKVTDLIFRARVLGQTQARNMYQVTSATHQAQDSYGVSETVAKEPAPAAAGGEAAASEAVKTIVREAPKVGRNDLCPCGSGKKYKKCHGAEVV